MVSKYFFNRFVFFFGIIFLLSVSSEVKADTTLLHEFAGGSDDGGNPYGDLIQDGDTLYGMTEYGGDDDYGTIFSIQTDGTGFTLLHEFTVSADDGAHPQGSLIQSGNTLYGMTKSGNEYYSGTIFSIQTDGTGFTLLHEFTCGMDDGCFPHGSLIQSGNILYGMTEYGGDDDSGTIFSIQTDGTGFTLFHEFAGGASDGRFPYGSLIQSGNTLYGMTKNGGDDGFGTIFSIQTDGTGFTLLHEFAGGASDGSYPYGSLIQSDTTLYGMTYNGGDVDSGTIFKIESDGTGFALLHEFANGTNDGGNPYGSLIQSGTTLYGMTYYGGDVDYGTLFSVSTNFDLLAPEMSLDAIDASTDNPELTGSVSDVGNTIVSTVASVEFQIDSVWDDWTTCTADDGTFDEVDEDFTCDLGTPADGEHTVYVRAQDSVGNSMISEDITFLHEFAGGGDDGSYPYDSLIQSGDTFYGMTNNGGDDDYGTIFSIQTDGTGFTLLHEFVGGVSDGSNPDGSLIQSGNTLYGMTNNGGDDDSGTIFSIQTDGTGFTLLYEFTSSADDGGHPYGSLIQSGDTLYGITESGGDDGYGTIFKIESDGTGFTLLHEFSGGASDGSYPYGSLIQSGDTLYGMTYYGGDDDSGTIFSIQTDGTGFTLLHEFAGGSDDGGNPYGDLIQDGNTLYGMTEYGGDDAYGTIFAVQTDGTGFTLLHEFAGGASDGSEPYGSLIQSGTTLYGMTYYGGYDDGGTIFSIQTDGTDFTLLYQFSGDGSYPYGSLIQSDTTLYGMTSEGGDDGYGTLFALSRTGYESATFTMSSVPDDSIPPAITLNSLTTPTNNPILTGTATEETGTVSNIAFKLDSGSFSSCTPDDGTFDEATESFTCNLGTPSEGDHTVYVRSTDSNTNTTQEGNYAIASFTYDSTNPSKSIQNLKFTKTSSSKKDIRTGSHNYTQEKNPKLKGTNTDARNGTVTIYERTKKGGTKEIGTASINQNGKWDYRLPKEKNKTFYYALSFTDQSGNTSERTKWMKIVRDTNKPFFIEPLPDTRTVTRGSRIDFLAKDKETDIDFYSVKILSQMKNFRKQDDSFFIVPERVPNGTYTLIIRAYDKAGNKAEGKITLVVR